MTDGVDRPFSTEPPPAPRRGGIGPFSWRQLGTVLGVVAGAAVLLVVLTRPLGPGANPGAPTALPGATPYLVGSPTTGVQVGQLAPELQWLDDAGATVQLRDLNGDPVSLEDLRGKLVWLNFWATWCPPCQAETPVLRDLDEQYRDQGLEIIGVAVQETSPDNVQEYAERYELGFRIAFDASADIFDLYRVFALPTQVFVGPDGRVLRVVNGPMTHEIASAWIEDWLPEGQGLGSPSIARSQ